MHAIRGKLSELAEPVLNAVRGKLSDLAALGHGHPRACPPSVAMRRPLGREELSSPLPHLSAWGRANESGQRERAHPKARPESRNKLWVYDPPSRMVE